MTANTAGLGPITKLLPVTGTFSAPLVGLTSLLAFNVIKTRVDLNTWQGDSTIDGDGKKVKQPDGHEYDPLLIATRIHANATENIPITLILAALAELNGADRKKLTSVLALFSVLRVLHVVGLAKATQLPRALGEYSSLPCVDVSADDGVIRRIWQFGRAAWSRWMGGLAHQGLLGFLDPKVIEQGVSGDASDRDGITPAQRVSVKRTHIGLTYRHSCRL